MYKKVIIIISFCLFFLNASFYAQAKDDSNFCFAVMGCLHFGYCDFQDYELAVKNIKLYNPDFMVFLGGMVDAMGEGSVESLWQGFDRITERLKMPVYNTSGDCYRLLPITIPQDRVALMKKCFLDRYKKSYYSFEYKNNLFICLDSDNLFGQERALIVKEQLDFLKNVIADVSRYDNVFIFMHDSPWFRNENEWLKVIHPLIKGKVKYVFGSGMHSIGQKRIDGVTYITSGYPPCDITAMSTVLRSHFFHFLTVKVDKRKISIKVVLAKPIPIENLVGMQSRGEKPQQRANDKILFKPYQLSAHERVNMLNPSRVIETLKIKLGMSILDIGAGTGIFTFPFAEALKGTGKVFATETDSSMIEYIKDKIEEGKYKNIFPILIQSKGVDPFYKQHTFDIIFLSAVYDNILHPEDYFRELRPSLAKNNGRLYIIHWKNVFDFSPKEFDDFREVIEILIPKGEEFPVLKRLDKEVKDFIKNWCGEDIPSEIRIKIIQGFNEMLSDRFLFGDLSDYYAAKQKPGLPVVLEILVAPQDVELANWLIVNLDDRKVFDKKKRNISDIDKRELSKLNRLLLAEILQSDKIHYFTSRGGTICLEKNSVISTMKAAGYQLVREYDFLPINYFLEFKRKL